MKNTVARVIWTIIIGILALICFYPLVWILINSLKPTSDIISANSFALPTEPYIQNYYVAIYDKHILKYFFNSLFVTICTIMLTVVVSCMLGYASTRMKWRHGGKIIALVTLGILLPSQIVVAPVFILIRTLKLVDTHLALVLTVSAFNVSISTLIAAGFLRSIPAEVEEAAVIDGANISRIFFGIIMPIIKPAISAMVINVFLNSWNEFIYALVLLNSDSLKTLPIMLMSFSELRKGTDYGGMFASMVLASLVPIAMYLCFSRQVEDALTAGSILK